MGGKCLDLNCSSNAHSAVQKSSPPKMYPARELKAELPSPAGLDVLDSTSDEEGVCMSVSAMINGSYLQW